MEPWTLELLERFYNARYAEFLELLEKAKVSLSNRLAVDAFADSSLYSFHLLFN